MIASFLVLSKGILMDLLHELKKKKQKKKQIGTRSTYNPSGGNMKSVLKGTGSLLVKVGNVPVALLGSFNVSRKFSLMAC